MVNNGQTNTMQPPHEITSIGFNPPSDKRLVVEAMTIDELRLRAPARHFEKLQRADFYRLIGVLEGHTKPMVDFSCFRAQCRDWLLVRPGQVFRYDFSQAWRGWLLVFRPDSLSVSGRGRNAGEFDLARRVEELGCQHSLDEEQHDWMNRSLQQMQQDGGLNSDVAQRNELLRLQLASTLLRLSMWQLPDHLASANSSSRQINYRRFRTLLETELSRQHQVRFYASALGMSEKTLSRICGAATGSPAKAVINQRLILEAKRLLAHTSMAVQAIGRELGFEEATAFIKFFRKETGTTPLIFRRKF